MRPPSTRAPGRHVRCLLAVIVLLTGLAATAAPAVEQERPRAADQPTAERLTEIFEAAEADFFSARQPSTIERFTQVVEGIASLTEDEISPELADLLVESLAYRARARLNLGEDEAATADLRRILELEPDYRFDPDMVSPKLSDTFAGLRDELVGRLLVDASPTDAHVLVDGRPRDWRSGPIPMVAGNHVVSVERPGFTIFQQEIAVAAGELTTVEAALERTHPVLILLAEPVGAEVHIDGRDVGSIEVPERTLLPEVVGTEHLDHPRIRIDDVAVGSHTLRISKEGFRPIEQPVALDDLSDYRLGPIELSPASGTLVLRGVPEGAEISFPGADVAPDWERDAVDDAADAVRAELPPGTYSLTVEAPDGARFEAEAEVRDGAPTTLDVDLRPAITYLGVVGGDELGREKVEDAVVSAVGNREVWGFRDRRSAGADLLGRLDVDVERLRDLADDRPMARARPFRQLRELLDREMRGSLYLLAVLSDDLVATGADVWLLAGEPAPPLPDRIRLDLEASAETLRRQLEAAVAPFRPYRAHLGAAVVDSGVVAGPVIYEVTDGSPAARAGLQVGDVVRSVDGDALDRAADLRGRLDAAGPSGEVTIVAERGPQRLEVRVPLDASPEVVRPDFDGRPLAPLWTLIERHEAGSEGEIPDWLLALNRTAILMRSHRWEAAVQSLRRINAPEGPGVGAGMVDYWLGMALQALGNDYRDLALSAFEEAAGRRDARLFHAGGPYVWPRARARADAMER